MSETKKWGGHITGFRADISQGRGPVYEVRRALGLSQAEMAARIGCSESRLRGWEREGTAPRGLGRKCRARQSALRGLAAEAGVDVGPLPDEGGVFFD